LNIVVAVVLASSPGIGRIVRGLVLELKEQDFVAAAQLRRESDPYIMLIELLPNCRGPLITDFCLRLGYTTITIGTLGFLGLGLLGESGCGKSTLIMAIMGYLGRNGMVTRGQILFEGKDLVKASEAELQAIRGARISIVYQEPATALNPSMTIGRQLMEVPI